MVRGTTVATPATRRELLGLASVSTAAVAVAGCGHHARNRSRNQPQVDLAEDQDARLLGSLLDLEYEVIAAYTAAIPLLSGRAKLAAKRFLGQELSHAGELGGLIREAKGKARPPQAAYALGRPASARAVLVLLHGLEQRELEAKLAAVPALSLGSTRAAVTAVLGSDAQHLSVLSAALGLDPAPSALPGG